MEPTGELPKPEWRAVSADVTVADCERTQQSWYDDCARAAGGASWQDGNGGRARWARG